MNYFKKPTPKQITEAQLVSAEANLRAAEDDLLQAKHQVDYHKAQIAHLKQRLGAFDAAAS